MNSSKITAYGTAVLAFIALVTIGSQFHKDGMRRIEEHAKLDGHPKISTQIDFVLDELKEMRAEFKEVKAELKEIRSCMSRIERQQIK